MNRCANNINCINMKNIYYLLTLSLLLTTDLNAQAKVAMCGMDGSLAPGDEFAFVVTTGLAPNEVIYFTEDEWSSFAGAFNNGEGHIAYTAPAGGLPANEVVLITESSNDVYTVGCSAGGTAVHVAGSGNWDFSSQDELYAYSASNPGSPWSSVTDVHCFMWTSVIIPPANQQITTDWPTGITIAFNVGGGGGVNANFMNSARTNTTIPDLQNGVNWTTSTGDVTLTCQDFTNNMLPIELISFDSKLRGVEVLLSWSTASEINNERFEIEHSTDGKTYNKIETLAGQGTSNRTIYYETIHSYPSQGMNYYRLKQVDFDGMYSYSDIEVVEYRNNKRISAYPNPFIQAITLEFSSIDYNYSSGNVRTIEVYDIYGKLALSQEVSMDETRISLDLSMLDGGVYFLHTLEGKSILSNIQKVIKI